MKRILNLFLCISLVATTLIFAKPAQAYEITNAQQLVDFLKTKIDSGGDVTKIKTADSNTTAQVSTSVTINEPFNVPSGVKLQLFVKMSIEDQITVNGKVQDSRSLDFRKDGLVGTGAGSVVLHTGSSYYQQGTEVIGSAGVLQLSPNSTVTLLSNSRLEVSSGTVTVATYKTLTTDMFKQISVAEGATLNVNGTIADGVLWPSGMNGVDKSALSQAISEAVVNKNAISVSADGADISTSTKWVLPSVMDQYTAAIASATVVKDNTAATEAQVNDALSVLATATSEFNAAKMDGRNNGVPAEIVTVNDLVAFLRTITVNDELVKINGNTAELYENIVIAKPVTIPNGVKLQSFADLTVNTTITVQGVIQDSRTPDKRATGLVGTGTGSVVFRTGSSYFQQGLEVVGTNGIFKLGTASSLTLYTNQHLQISSGIVTLAKPVTTAVVQKITVAPEAAFNFTASNIGEGVDFTPASVNLTKLNELIKLAEANADSTLISTDGVEVNSDQDWVTEVIHHAFMQAIQSAIEVKNKVAASEDEYNVAVSALESAYDAFNDAKRLGEIHVDEITTADQLLETLNGFKDGVEPIAKRLSDEKVGEQTFKVVEVFMPVTVSKQITVPSDVRLKFSAQMTVNSKVTVRGQLQDFRDEGFIVGNGIIGSVGVGSAVFEPGSALYIKGKGETIGPTGMIRVEQDASITMYAKNRMEISKGRAVVMKPLITSLTTELMVQSGAELLVIGSIPNEITVKSSGTYTDASVTNTEAQLGLSGSVVTSSDEMALTASLQDGRIYMTVKSQEIKTVTVTVKSADERTATIEAAIKNGAMVSKTIVKHGALSVAELKAHIDSKIVELEGLIAQAQALQLDAEREKGAVWFAKEFDKYADWDGENQDVNKKMFATIPSYSPGGKSPEELAADLPEFERTEVIALLNTAIAELTEVLNGTVVRRPVRLVDWDGIQQQGSNFYSEGKPVFLHDYFSKPLDVPKDNPTLYNDYLGNIDLPKSINPSFITDFNGTPASDKYVDLQNRPTNNIGYTMLWHDPVPSWAVSASGETIRDGITTFTKYDINNPAIRSIWSQVLKNTGPITTRKPYTGLGYLLANEPHWFLEKGHWATPKKANGEEGISDLALHQFANWLEARHQTLAALNTLWGTSYTSFDEAARSVIPMDKNYKGTPIGYDVSLFNMERGTDWLSFLNQQVKANDPQAKTHIKIMPDLFVEDNRTHGINFEKLTEMVDIIGDDAKTRKENFKSTGQLEDWKDHYAYMWKEMAMSYDFMSSVSPEKAHVNSEVHFLSTVAYRDLYMKPEYVRNTYWLATLLGMDAGFTWYWGRNPDGSIENRLMTTTVQGLLESYPGTVAQQPRVANELSKTMMDLNAFSEEMVKFQEQRKPVRLFYSETAAIDDTHYMEDQFELYESLYFNGVPVGFATGDIIEKQPHSNWDVVVIRKTEEVTDEEFAALQSYLNEGGTVIVDDVSLKLNEYKQPRGVSLTAGNGVLIHSDEPSASSMADQAFGVLAQKGSLPPVVMDETNGTNQRGAIWRVIPNGADRYIMTVVNIGKNEASLHIKLASNGAFKIKDMMTGKELSTTPSLKSEGVMLLEIDATQPPANTPVQSVNLDKSAISLIVGQEEQLTATVQPEQATNRSVTWSVYSESGLNIASVSDTGLVTALNAGTATIRATSVANANHYAESVVTVLGSNISSGSIDDGNRSDNNSSTTSSGVIRVSAMDMKQGVATALIADANLSHAVKEAKDKVVRLQVVLPAEAQEIQLKLPVQGVIAAIESKMEKIAIDTGLAIVTISPDMLQSMAAPTSAYIELTVKKVTIEHVTEETRQLVKDNPVYDFTLAVDGKEVSRFGNKNSIELQLPYALKPGERPSHIVGYYINDKGGLEVVKNSRYDEVTGRLVFAVKHFSLYTAASAKGTFKDLGSVPWATESIEALAVREIVNGTSADVFQPEQPVTRAQFVHMLMNAYELTNDNYVPSFTDVQHGAWYESALGAAESLGIVNGLADGRFGINDMISRQDMAVMVQRLLESQRIPITVDNDTRVSFKDEPLISGYAVSSVKAMQSLGFMEGGENNTFDPLESATRAQAAVLVYRIINKK
ncbi:S-layer homology domain-containing protein [Paenibacillus ferrarius]|uniref:S-layer homology domain-containing protein n=1 Tax=Paenibacillus ferrarius TaxID=1469647 RepID=UPI003D2AC82D